MPDEYVVMGIQDTTIDPIMHGQQTEPAFQVSMRKPDGTLGHHIMPKHAIEARALEYDLDPDADFDTVLDIILHEPHAPNAGEPHDPAVEAGYHTKIRGMAVAASLHTAETIKDAREAELLRTQWAKDNAVRIKIPKEHRDELLSKHRMELRKKDKHPELQRLKQRLANDRRTIRGRPDGKPLKG